MTPDTEPAPTAPGSSSHPTEATHAPCDCAHQVASQSDAKAIFSELNHGEEYFPMIARIGNETFFGIPPPPVAPEAATEGNAVPPMPMTNPVTNAASRPWPERQDIVADDVPLGLSTDNSEDEDEDEDTLVYIPAGNTSVNADTPRRRPQARSSHRRQESQNTDAIDPLAWNQDEKIWQTWHEQDLPEVFSRLIPKRRTGSLVWKASVTYCTIQSLNSTNSNRKPCLLSQASRPSTCTIPSRKMNTLEFV